MMNETSQDIMDALDDLLEKERTALLAGNLDGIARLLGEKERLIDHLNAIEVSQPEALSALHSKVQRNQGLLDSALKGIRAVASRMGSLRRIRKSLDTYNEDGSRSIIHVRKERTVEKRA